MKKSIFYKSCKIYNSILKKNLKYFTFAFSSLHISRAHNSLNILSRKLPKKNILFRIRKYIFENLASFNSSRYKNNFDVIIVSSISSLKQSNNPDKTFENIIYFLKKNKINFLIIKRNFTDSFINNYKSSRNNFILNNSRNIFHDIFYLLSLFLNALNLFLKVKKKSEIEKKLFKELFTLRNFSSSLFNINHTNNIFNLIKYHNPKKVFFTYEGLPWEKLLNYKIKMYNNKIKTYGYFFSIVSEFHNSPFVKLNQNYEPDFILSSGNYAKKKFLDNGFKEDKIFNIGLNKSKNNLIPLKKNKNCKKNCLLIPEAFEEEIFILIDFALETLKKNKKIKFILRLHPSTDVKLISKVKKYLTGKHIFLSKSSLESDLSKSSIALYRGSSTIIKAIKANLLPVYIPKNDELSIDPLFELRKQKPKINSSKDFIILYDALIKNNFKYSRKKINIIKKFNEDYFSSLQYKNISKIFKV